jgi:hypothetical protein
MGIGVTVGTGVVVADDRGVAVTCGDVIVGDCVADNGVPEVDGVVAVVGMEASVGAGFDTLDLGGAR